MGRLRYPGTNKASGSGTRFPRVPGVPSTQCAARVGVRHNFGRIVILQNVISPQRRRGRRGGAELYQTTRHREISEQTLCDASRGYWPKS
jgi:hypothetical protein